MRWCSRRRLRRCTRGGLCALVCTLLMPCSAAHAERLPIKTFTTADGLAHDTVRRIVLDSRGFLWFCTAQGLSRFDGQHFFTYGAAHGLPTISINDLLETSQGEYWVATNGGGVARFTHTDAGALDGRTAWRSETRDASRFTAFSIGEDAQANRVNAIYEDRAGRLWAGTDAGLFVLNGTKDDKTFERVTLGLPGRPDRAVHVWAFVEDRQGSLWIGTSWGLVRRFPSGRVVHHAIQPAGGADHVRAVLIDPDERLWIGHATGLIVLAPKETLNVRARALNTAGVSGGVRSLLISSEGRIWIGTLDSVTEFDGQQFRTFTKRHGVSGALALAEDPGGNLWLAPPGAGASKLARHGFSQYGEDEGLIGTDFRVFEDSTGELYVSGRHIHHFDGTRFTAVRPNLVRDVAEHGAYVALRDRLGEWWIAGGAGLYRFPSVHKLEELARVSPKAIYTTRHGLAGDDIFTLFEDSRGDLWIGRRDPTSQVLTRWERSTGTFHRYSDADGLPAFNRTIVFTEDRAGNVWIGFWTGGVARYRAGRFTVFTAADGWPAGAISSLYVDTRGRLWVGASEGGLARVDEPAADRPRLVSYTTANGLASQAVRCITEDRQSRIYLGLLRGLDRLDPDSGRVRHYTAADGVSDSPSTAFRDREGTLWFSTPYKLFRLIPSLDPDPPSAPPSIFIGGLRIAGASLPVSDLGEREISNIALGPDQNRVQIEFLSVGVSSPTVRYQFQLEGADSTWSEPTDQRSVTYASLSPGSYRFMLRAIAADGQLSTAPATVAFTIHPPFWRRWWFLAFVSTVVAGVLYTTHRYRLARLLDVERVRTRIATDLHDDLGANLSQIAILSEVAQAQVAADYPAVRSPLSRIASLSRESVDAMSEIVWAIDPHRDHFTDLATRIRRLANELLPPRGIQLRFRISEGAAGPMGADVRREVFLVFKEAVNNVVRHASCTEVDVTLLVVRHRLRLEVNDNGKGFSAIDSADGQGHRSMRRRAQSLGGRLDITTLPGSGTSVRLTMPF